MSDQQSPSTPPTRPSGQLKLLAIIAIVIGPILVAWIMAKTDIGIPDSQTNRSELVQPELNLQDWQMQVEPIGYGAPWRLLVTSPGDCEQDCLALLHEARQINVALGREAARVAHMLALGSDAPEALQQRLAEEYPRMQQAQLDGRAYHDSLTEHPEAWQQGPQLWVVDPLGRVVLHQDVNKPGKQLLDDLKHLLKVSKIG
ncbi:MAG: hypothetical protein ACK4VV_00155 [Pseudomonas sp.]